MDNKKIYEIINNMNSFTATSLLDAFEDITFDAYVVHVGFNANGAYFDKGELAKSFESFHNQPVNVNHKANTEVGKINKAYWIDNEEAVIVNATVYSDKVREIFQNDAPVVLSKIETSMYKVSMECLPGDVQIILYDMYTAKKTVLPIDESTQELLFYIPQFGGAGVVDNRYVVGLYLKDITFVGMALTETPADNRAEIIKLYNNLKLVAKTEEKKMDELKAKIDALENELKEMKSSYQEIQQNFENAQKEIEKMKANIESKDSKIEELNTAIENLTNEKAEIQTAKEELEQKLNDTVSEKETVESSLQEAENKLLLLERKSAIETFDVDIEDEKLLAFTDEQFNVFVATLKQVAEDTSKDDIEVDVNDVTFKADEEKEGLPSTNDIENEDFGEEIIKMLDN